MRFYRVRRRMRWKSGALVAHPELGVGGSGSASLTVSETQVPRLLAQRILDVRFRGPGTARLAQARGSSSRNASIIDPALIPVLSPHLGVFRRGASPWLTD